jgi:tRNA nucleotidyltransferase (CCA-adding enzyme)
MNIVLPIEPLFIIHTLKKAGHQAFIVGGAVRDLLQKDHLGTDASVTDYDLTTDATPDQIKELFSESFYENQFGTVSITQEHTREQAGLQPIETQEEEKDVAINPLAATKLHVSLQLGSTISTSKKTHQPLYEITTYRSDGIYTDHRRPQTVTWGTSLEEDLQRRDFTINAMALTISNAKLLELFDIPDTVTPDQVHLNQSEY